MRTVNPFPKIFVDFDDATENPGPGDYIVTSGKRGLGTAYLIRSVRKVQRRRRKVGTYNRFVFTCERESPDTIPAGAQVWTMRWYPRLRRRQAL